MAESIRDKVAIVGMGCTRFGELWDKSVSDLMVDAAFEAFEDAGIEPKDIDAAWIGHWTETSGMTGLSLSGTLGLQYKPVTRIENACATGSDCLRNAAYAVACGVCDIALVVGAEKLKDMGIAGLPNQVPLGTPNLITAISAPGLFAMMATSYFHRYGLSPQEGKRMMAHIPVKSHRNGIKNPKAHFKREITLEQVLNSPMIAWPLGIFDCCGTSDGSAAAIVVRASEAGKFRPDPVYIKALQICANPADGARRNDFDFAHIEATYRAGLKAYAEAGVKNPRKEISMAEVHDCFSINEAIVMEDLQFSPRGRVKEDIEAGFFNIDGALPVQPSGGLKCFGHPVAATGLRMLYEMYKQLQGKAGPRQIESPKLGLSQNMGGHPADNVVSCVIVGV
jgi:acetyl-CoA C-acetyltransferase